MRKASLLICRETQKTASTAAASKPQEGSLDAVLWSPDLQIREALERAIWHDKLPQSTFDESEKLQARFSLYLSVRSIDLQPCSASSVHFNAMSVVKE